MKNKEKIIINGPKILNDKILIFELKFSKNVANFFSNKELKIEYPVNINSLDSSVQSIPALASVIGIAWLSGADVYLKTIDKNFLESLDKIRLVMKKWYPKFPFSSKIIAKSKINRFIGGNFGLLYSAGLDSTTSYIKHREKNLVLISISGEGESIDSQFRDDKIITPLSCKDDGIFVIKTNIEKVVNEKLVYEKFGLNWWMNLSHGLVLSGHCAPLAGVKNIDTLYLASSFTRDFNYPWGSHPSIDNNIRWATTKVVHDGFDTTRQEKILYFIKEFGEEMGDFPKLKVCSKYQVTGNNCQKCEKCSRTIIGLLAAGIDPNKCGFKINEENIDYIKESLEKGVFFSKRGIIERPVKLINRIYPIFEWQDIQQNLPSVYEYDMYGSANFFEWFRNFSVIDRANRISYGKLPRLFLYSVFDLLAPLSIILPKQIQDLLRSSFDYFFTNKRIL